ncbi:BREX-1 system adenine-specific DNA-methyltransferase PglX [Pseudomonas hygromyciniae]|uniref:site-specific DNA-methyltransferase (adenine-specific) n=1 Tax=Pseudomonas hygromyciniae TaxID=2812000 RepID=A0ABX7K751_9PSED|nr:BREX-1 system adenine-specific DNA-methyltransferase PglX [Pseudomonas hygromyciniae]QSB42357.1 BREX-1 system adenine-specific DNA-methyltransferase PglX [Pseudomonas hygromyciniae]
MKRNFKGFDKDLFSAFIIRNLQLVKDSGNLGYMSPFVWMFISSYKELRQYILGATTLTSLIQLEYSGFDGATVPVCTFTISKAHIAGFNGSYIRLSDFRGAENQGPKTLEAIQNPNCGWFYVDRPDDFMRIPDCPIAYWLGSGFKRLFSDNPSIASISTSAVGLQTGSNEKFMRAWHEVSFGSIGFGCENRMEASESSRKWFPYNKGGAYRKWYGNFEYVVNWGRDGVDIRGFKDDAGNLRSRPQNVDFYFRESITWSEITSSWKSFRFSPAGSIYDVKGQSAFFENGDAQLYALAWLNSNVVEVITKIINPSLSFQSGDYRKIPLPASDEPRHFVDAARQAISIAKHDWDTQEASWDFQGLDFCTSEYYQELSDAWEGFRSESDERVLTLKSIEEGNNERFISLSGLQGEIDPEVPHAQITLCRAERGKDMQRMISYSVGCIMGRYSLDEPGLIYACSGNLGFDSSRYTEFPADADGILPVTDESWFEDDAAERMREFVKVVWGADTLVENMEWLADSLGRKTGESADEAIRRYLSTSFYKDHLQTYKKRPIYWLFSSGKQKAFECLVYLHRYNEGTLSRMRMEYVVPLQSRMQARIDKLADDINSATGSAQQKALQKRKDKFTKQLEELRRFDETLRPYADQRIALDLDDGVKVNYGKFGDLLAEVKAITGGKED